MRGQTLLTASLLTSLVFFNGGCRRLAGYAYYQRGLSCYEKEDYDCAVSNFTGAIACKYDLASSYGMRALSELNKGDYDAAISDCNAALAINPEMFSAYGVRAMALKQKGEQVAAEADERRSKELQDLYLRREDAKMRKILDEVKERHAK
jgi:tetratricopeptide (TPR) repeat protein